MVIRSLAPLLLSGAVAVGQDVGGGLPVVAMPEPGEQLSAMRSFSQGATADGSGRLWTLVQVLRGDERVLQLHCSEDGGESWRRRATVPGSWSSFGAVSGESDGAVLHVVWTGRDDGEFHSAMYQRFDTGQNVWLGEPEVLQAGNGDEDQYGVADLAVDRDGSVVTVVTTHRHPPQPPWPSGWSSGLMVRGAGADAWRGPFPVHANRYGVWTNLQLLDRRVHVTFRTTPSHSMIGYRSFALADRKFTTPKEAEISVHPRSGQFVSNASSLVVSLSGARTVLYPAAGRAMKTQGQLMVAHASADGEWRSKVLVDDPQMRSGNVAHEHFGLVRGPGDQTIALYSKVSEGYQVLYRRILEAGKPMEPEKVVARSNVAGAFHRIATMRDERLQSRLWAVVSADQGTGGFGVRAVLAPRPVKTRWH